MRKLLAVVTVALMIAAGVPITGAFGFTVDRHQAEIDEHLARQLAAAGPDAPLMAMVHGRDSDSVVAAVRDIGLEVVDVWEGVDVVVAAGPAARVEDLARDRRVTRLEGDRPLQLMMQTSHRATRGEEALAGFAGYVLEEQPDLPGEITRKCDRVRERYRDRRGRRRTRTVTRCREVQGPSRPQPPVRRDVASAGVDGRGVGIAVIDSGVDGTHPMFMDNGKSRVVRNLKLACPAGPFVLQDDFCTDERGARGTYGNARDGMFLDLTATGNNTDTISAGGHGTHVAGIAGGALVATSDGRRFHGAAPGTRIVSLSVGAVISVIGANAALNWVLEHHARPCGPNVPAADCPPIKVVNNSYGPDGGGEHDPKDADSLLVSALAGAGVVTVWAAGNDGADANENTNPPGQSPTAGVLMVANYNDGDTGTRDGQLADSSSRGRKGLRATYPDLSAPGTNILSACRPHLPICVSGESDPNYGEIGGTSMAAPHVAGIVAQLIQAGRESLQRDLTPAEIEDILEDTAYRFLAGAPYEAEHPERNDGLTSVDKGHGLVDAKAAVARVRGMLLDDGPQPAATDYCRADGRVVTDARGDAVDSSTDVVTGDLAYDDATKTVTAVVSTGDLQRSYPSTYNGQNWYVDFTIAGTTYFLVASRDQVSRRGVDTESVALGRLEGSIRRQHTSTGMTGTFDYAGDRIVITFNQKTVDAFNTAVGAAALPALAPGVVLPEISMPTYVSRTAVAVGALTASDSAGNGCQFVLGAGAAPQAAPPPLDEPPPAGGGSDPGGAPEPRTDGGGPVSRGQAFEARGAPKAVQADYTCKGLGDERCFTYKLDVAEAGTLAFSVEAFEAADYDVYLYDARGQQIASGIGLPFTVFEEGEAAVQPGRYYLVVQPFTAAPQTPFVARASLA